MTGQHHPRRRFGQNFLRDDQVIQRIVSAAHIGVDDTVVEIGPGQGALTRYLLSRCKNLIAIELDRDLASRLRQQYAADSLQLLEADALKVNLSELVLQPYRLMGNLPYNISTPLLFHFFAHLNAWKDAHVMLQKEVAQRITAVPGHSEYSRLSVMTRFYADAEILFDVPPEAFYPAPKVTSSIVRLVPRQPILTTPQKQQQFSELVKACFAQRRKTLANNLKGIISRESISQAGIDPGYRAQVLDVDSFVRLLKVQHQDSSATRNAD